MAHDLRFALRMILAHRWFSAAVVVTLALGIGLNTMVFTLVNAVLFKPVGVANGARLVTVNNRNPTQGRGEMRMSLPELRDVRAQAKGLAEIEAVTDEPGVLSERGNPAQAFHMERATAGLFDMLQVRPVLGRGFLPGEDKAGAAPVVLLGYGVWKDRYASAANVIGRAVHVNQQAATIVGVMPEGFKFPANTDFWMPLIPEAAMEKRDNRPLQAFAMLQPGVSVAQARAEMQGIAQRLAKQYPATNKDLTATVETFHQHFNGGNIRTIFLLMLAAVVFVLLIACANVANMMLSRALGRQREMSIRTALGATRWRVMRQLLIESVLLSVAGGVLGLGLAAGGVHWFDLQTLRVRPYWILFQMDFAVFGYFAALCIVTGLLFGVMPALRSSKVNLNEVMKEGARSVGKRGGGKISAGLVVLQFGLTLVLLSGAGIFVHSLLLHLGANRFVPADRLMTGYISFPADRYKDTDARQRFIDQLVPRLLALPSVSHVALTSDLPGTGSAERGIELEHESGVVKNRPRVAMVVQTPGAFAAINLPLLLGRDFNALDGTENHHAAVVTRAYASHFWPQENAVGKRFRLYDDDNKPGEWMTVVGVSADIEQDLSTSDPKPVLFVPFRQEKWDGMSLMVQASANPTSAVRAVVQSLDAELPLRDVAMLSAELDQQQWFLHVFTTLFLAFAGIGMLMAAVGLYAVIAHATGSRTQEIGVRMALGANARNILLLVMKGGLWQIGMGLVLGLGAAIPAVHLMSSLPIGVSASDPVVIVAVSVVLSAVGIFACWLPARKAAALDPVKAIRYE
jgi:putative ABC transport system permease protein